ncbi:MAG: M24 family metallopeptidase [Candidatus Helarchaeota archaeon]
MSIGDSDPEAPGTGIKVRKNQSLRLDVGALYKGYVSDVNRMVYVGDKIPPDFKNPIDAIIQVQDACQKAIKPAVDPKEILRLAEETWREAGRKDQFIIMGHSIGLKTEEYHFFDPMRSKFRKFQKGNVLNIEAWTLLKGYGTIGNEDQYVITENGCKRISTLEMKIFQIKT